MRQHIPGTARWGNNDSPVGTYPNIPIPILSQAIVGIDIDRCPIGGSNTPQEGIALLIKDIETGMGIVGDIHPDIAIGRTDHLVRHLGRTQRTVVGLPCAIRLQTMDRLAHTTVVHPQISLLVEHQSRHTDVIVTGRNSTLQGRAGCQILLDELILLKLQDTFAIGRYKIMGRIGRINRYLRVVTSRYLRFVKVQPRGAIIDHQGTRIAVPVGPAAPSHHIQTPLGKGHGVG